MLYQSYNQRVNKERLETYRKHFEHLTLTKHPDPEPSEAGAGHFSIQNSKNTTNTTRYSLVDTLSTNGIQEENDNFIDQCIEEYFTWLAQTEKKARQLRNSPLVESYKPTDFSILHDKEATTDL